jgi:protein O-mannosyl-transferase
MSNELLLRDTLRHSRLALATLLGLVIAIYWPVVGYDFVNWDDPWYVLKNPLIRSWDPENLWKIATEISVKNYAPLTTLSLLIDHTLFGLNPAGYHLVNVVLHATNSVLVFLLIARLTESRSVALATAALFAVHPIQIETVAWVSSRKTLLCSLFMLASALCWCRPQRSARAELWGTAFLGLALLAKAAAVVMPPMVLAYDVLVRRERLSEAVSRQIIPAFLCLLLLSANMSAQNQYMGGIRHHMSLGKLHILGIDSIILWRYVAMLAAPADLSLLYDPPTRGIASAVLAACLGWGAVGWICWRTRRTRPLLAVAVICWFCLLAPVLNLFPITTLMNDRYLYLPCVCLFAPATALGRNVLLWLGVRWHSFRPQSQVSAIIVPAALTLLVATGICGYALATMQRLPVWKTDEALWERTVEQVPQLAVVQIQRADSLHSLGRTDAAIAALHSALEECRADAADEERIRQRLRDWQAGGAGN